MKCLKKKEILEAIAQIPETNEETKVVIRTMAGDVGVVSVKASSDKSKIILTTQW